MKNNPTDFLRTSTVFCLVSSFRWISLAGTAVVVLIRFLARSNGWFDSLSAEYVTLKLANMVFLVILLISNTLVIYLARCPHCKRELKASLLRKAGPVNCPYCSGKIRD